MTLDDLELLQGRILSEFLVVDFADLGDNNG